MVNVNTITQQILQMEQELAQNKDSVNSQQVYAQMLAQIIYNAITSATVNAGIPVSTTGSSTAQAGATTSTGTLS